MSRQEDLRPRAIVVGIAGPDLGDDERRLIAARPPLGFILFARNCESRKQLRALTASLRDAAGREDAPILIDQEGGRVMRLRPPEWRALPAAAQIGALALRDRQAGSEAAGLSARLIAHDLREVGVDVDCAPVLDLREPGASDVVGNRSYGPDPDLVSALGRAAIGGFLAGGVLPVIKHLPGHGRARVDSHVALPVVDCAMADLEARDLLPFRACRDAPLGMTAHIVFTRIDPETPATCSSAVIDDVIRGRIGFEGALFSDDLCMGALGGSMGDRVRRALAAGCDIALHCSGRIDELAEVLEVAPVLAGAAADRVARAMTLRRTTPAPFDAGAAQARLEALLAQEQADAHLA